MAHEDERFQDRLEGPEPGPSDDQQSSSRRKQLMESQVLEHATRLFAERGFSGTSLQDVAHSMGLKRPAIYYYFKSKEALLDRIIFDATTGPAADLDAIGARSDLDPAARLHMMAQFIVTWIATHTHHFLLLVKSESELSPESTKKFNDGRRATLRAVSSVIEEGIETGQFRPVDPGVATFGVWGICNWVAFWYRPERSASSIESIAVQLADMAVASLQRAEHRESGILSPRYALATIRDNLDRLEQALDLDEMSPDHGAPRGNA